MNDGLRSIDVAAAADGEGPTRAVRPPGLESDLAIFRPAAIHGRWGLGLMAIGWVHLATFMSCHVLYVTGDRRAVPYMAVWCLELAVVVALIRRMVTNNGRIPPPPRDYRSRCSAQSPRDPRSPRQTRLLFEP